MGRQGKGTRGSAIVDALLELAWPTRCIGCDQPGELLCPSCRAQLPWIEQRLACPVCGTPYGWLTCSGCRRGMESSSSARKAHEPTGHQGLSPLEAGELRRLELLRARWPMRANICACSLEGTPARMVTGLKDGHELRLAPVMAAAMACALDEASSLEAFGGGPRFDAEGTDALCYVPATAQAYARRGFDHMELVARPLAGFMGLPLADVLVRESARDQRALGRDERAENLSGGISVIGDVAGLHLLLADDVTTTGATLAATTRALLARGAASVTSCTFARAW